MSDNRARKGHFRSSVYKNKLLRIDSELSRTKDQVVHLYITGEPVKPSDRDGQVFVIYQDLHVCGACKKEFVDVVEFLHHKAEHSLGKDLYKCDLCKTIISSQELLKEHFDLYHQLSFNFTCVTKLPDDGGTSLPVEDRVKTNGHSEKLVTADALFQTSLPSVKPNVGKRKSKLQVKPMLAMESGILEENDDLGESALFDAVFPKLEEAGEFVDFTTSDIKPSNDDGGFIQGVASGEEESGAEECHNGIKVADSHVEPLDFDFVCATEHGKPSRFSHARTWLHCLRCDYRTRKHALLTGHMANFHKDQQELDQSERTVARANLVQGQKIMRMSAYEATLVSNKRAIRSKHQRRLEKQDVPGTYPCGVCGKTFSRFRYLRKHQETHQTEKMYVCDDCGKSYKSRTYLRVHRRVHVQKKEFSCNQCNFVSSINAAIHAHRQIHNSGSVICDICGYAYTDRSTLGKHKRVHDLSRPFACNFPGCKWRFKTEVMCRAHIRAHTTQGKFRCAVCGYVFRHKHHLQRHELHMHGVKTAASQPSTISSAVRHKDFTLDDDSDHFLPISDLDLPHDLTSDLPPDLDHEHLVGVQDVNGLPIDYGSADLSISVDYGLLNLEELNSKDDDDKSMLTSELEVFN